MKKWNYFVLFTVMLCLIGCGESGDSPLTPEIKPEQETVKQSVKLSKTEASVSKEGGKVEIDITANCAWTLTKDKDGISLSSSSGNGNAKVTITVAANESFEEVKYTVTLTSQDRSSSAAMSITQKKNAVLQVEAVDTIQAEGCDIKLPIKTSEKFKITGLPDWIEDPSSRAVVDTTVILNVKPNESGSFRTAAFKVEGETLSEEISISQHSFAPTGIDVAIPDSLALSETPYGYAMKLVPEYADWSKLSMEATKGTIEVVGDSIFFTAPELGAMNISAEAEGEEIFSKEIHVFDPSVATGIVVDIPDVIAISDEPYTFKYKLIPETANWETLDISAVGCSASIDEEKITLKTDIRGNGAIYIRGEGLMYSKMIKFIVDYVKFNIDESKKLVVGKQVTIRTNLADEYVSVKSLDETIIRHNNEYLYDVLDEGEVTLVATNLLSNKTDSVTLTCTKLDVNAEKKNSFMLNGRWTVDFNVEAWAYNLGAYELNVYHEDNPDKIIGNHSSQNAREGVSRILFIVEDINLTGSDWESTAAQRKKYIVHFKGMVDGEEREMKTTF